MSAQYCSGPRWAFLRLLRKTGALAYLNLTVPAMIAGRAVRVPIRHGVGMNLLLADEPWMEPLLRILLDRFPGAFIDVGVNVGQTLCKVKGIDPAREYYGFEPDPGCAHYSQELAVHHGYDRTRILSAGLSNIDGILTLEYHSTTEADSSATTVSDFRPGFPVLRRKSVPVLRFDTCSRDMSIERVGTVKIDVEGGELEVLQGMEARIGRDRPAVILEILPPGKHATRLARQQEVEALFARTGYSLFRIAAAGHGLRLTPIVGAIGIHDDQSLSNYLALPSERQDALPPDLISAGQA